MAEPTIAKALNAGFDLLEVKCNRCRRASLVPLRSVRRSPATPIWKLEEQLRCEPCSDKLGRRQRAHILGLTFIRPDPEPNRAAKR